MEALEWTAQLITHAPASQSLAYFRPLLAYRFFPSSFVKRHVHVIPLDIRSFNGLPSVSLKLFLDAGLSGQSE